MWRTGSVLVQARCNSPLINEAPQYLVVCCIAVSGTASRYRLHSAHSLLTAPRHRRSTLGRRAFSVAEPTGPTQRLRLHGVHIQTVTEVIYLQPVLMGPVH